MQNPVPKLRQQEFVHIIREPWKTIFFLILSNGREAAWEILIARVLNLGYNYRGASSEPSINSGLCWSLYVCLFFKYRLLTVQNFPSMGLKDIDYQRIYHK